MERKNDFVVAVRSFVVIIGATYQCGAEFPVALGGYSVTVAMPINRCRKR